MKSKDKTRITAVENEIHRMTGEIHSDGLQKEPRHTERTKDRTYTGQNFET